MAKFGLQALEKLDAERQTEVCRRTPSQSLAYPYPFQFCSTSAVPHHQPLRCFCCIPMQQVIRREKYHESLEDEEQIPKGMGEELAKLQNEISRMKRKRSNIEGDRKEALKEHAKLELDGEEIKGAVGKEKETGNRIKRELKKIQQQIKVRQLRHHFGPVFDHFLRPYSSIHATHVMRHDPLSDHAY